MNSIENFTSFTEEWVFRVRQCFPQNVGILIRIRSSNEGQKTVMLNINKKAIGCYFNDLHFPFIPFFLSYFYWQGIQHHV